MTVGSCATALFLFNIALAVNASEIANTSMIIDDSSGNYIVYLSERSALDSKYNVQGVDRRSALKIITKQQDDLINKLQSIYSKISINSKSKLIENSLHIRLPHRFVKTIQQNSSVISIEEVPYDKTLDLTSTHQKRPEFLYIPKQGATVAIVGNGVDYTHSQLGGSGKPSVYQQVINTNKISKQYFPTEKIIGGMTFPLVSNGHKNINYNPIENSNNLNVTEGFYPSGTVQASLILEQAPKAKIIVYKTSDLTWKQLYPSIDLIIDPNQDGILDDGPNVLLVNYFDNVDYEHKNNNALINKHFTNISNAGIAIVAPNNQTGELLSNIASEKMMISNVDFITHRLSTNISITGAIIGSGNETKEMELINGYNAAYYAGFIAKLKNMDTKFSLKNIKKFMNEKNNFIAQHNEILSD